MIVILPLTQGRTELNRINSPLLRLPGGLRNKVYDYATSGYILCIKKFCNPNLGVVKTPLEEARASYPPTLPTSVVITLRQVCR